MDDVQALIDLAAAKNVTPELPPPPSEVPPQPTTEHIPSTEEVATGVPVPPPQSPLMPNNPNIAPVL